MAVAGSARVTLGAALVAACAAVGFLPGSAFGALTEFNTFHLFYYTQNSGAAPVSVDMYQFVANARFEGSPNAFDSGTMTYPGSGSPVSLTPNGNEQLSYSADFGSLADLNTAFPHGTYSVVVHDSTNTNPDENASLNYTTQDLYPITPALTASSYAALTSFDPTLPLTVQFNSFTVPQGASSGATFFDIYDPSNTAVFGADFLASSTTSVTIPANVLTAGVNYRLELDFSNRIAGQDDNGNFNDQGFDTRTRISFTPVTSGTPSVPEPMSLAILTVGGLATLVRRRAR